MIYDGELYYDGENNDVSCSRLAHSHNGESLRTSRTYGAVEDARNQ